MSIVVTGGAGQLGRVVIESLAARGESALPASRRTGVDLRTGARLRSVLADADVVVHCASHPVKAREVDLDGTRRMIDILGDLGRRPHLIYVSIVGVDHIRYPYYRAKYATEIALKRSGLPVTVVRATQFHSLLVTLSRAFTIGPTAFVPYGFRSEPVDVAAVAERLAEMALGPAPDGFVRAPDVAGPERLSLLETVDEVARHDGRPIPRKIKVPAWGGALSDFAAGGNLSGKHVERIGPAFAKWLASQPSSKPEDSRR